MTSPAPRFVAVLDVGKTNAKVVLHDLGTAADLVVRTTPNTVVRDGLYPHFDVDRIFGFAIAALRDIAAEHAVDAISITTHGASATLVGDDDLALPVLDYEYDGPDALAEDYDRLRPPFSESFSPRLPGGLNVGAQFFWQQRTFPDEFAKVRNIVTYPQYWGWRLTGERACDPTSLGCHADLWNPQTGTPSSFAISEGWADLFAPVHSPFDVIGSLKADIARATGLSTATPVLCGIHDSNASLLPHLMGRKAPFAVVSTGTWTISFAVGGSFEGLDPDRDTLAYTDAFGRGVASARAMAGREFDILTAGASARPTDGDIARVIRNGVMALPAFVPGSGPFRHRKGNWTVDPASLTPGERVAAASLYSAIITVECLGLVSASGPTVVEGPVARNPLILAALRQLTGRPVEASRNITGTSAGAALLALGPDAVVEVRGLETVPDPGLAGLEAYAAAWRAAAMEG